MDLVQGGELSDFRDEELRFSEEVTKFYAIQIIDAVRYLHNKDIIHRDLKLENLLVKSNGYLYLIDYGLSKRLYKDQSTGSFCGTADYMAPEILNEGSYNKSVDLWAIGIMLYELLFGMNPYNMGGEDFTPQEYKENIQ
jgi:serine/threonine protein kinase